MIERFLEAWNTPRMYRTMGDEVILDVVLIPALLITLLVIAAVGVWLQGRKIKKGPW